MYHARYIILALLASALPFSSSAEAADAPPPGHYMINSADAIEIGTTLQFAPMQSEPVACSERLLGTVSLTSALRLCVCEGGNWIFESTGARCDWKVGRAGATR